ncbi:DNA ligase [Candidatus Liberibacter asiaticus]|uniref:DNA ligase LigA-related protein n=1 Tax=Liberibacter asiaticus TaxID=34021 RepID=UPI00058B24D1|nr:DNA ligase [Candidatus Liberibacter asiaticus]KIH96272.1 DNA ligase [Candidatus Liberibacter asiaticus]
MYNFDRVFRSSKFENEHNITPAQWKKLLTLEAKFLPNKRALESWLDKAKKVTSLSKGEAMIEVEYLVKIALHHQKWYYRLDNPLVTDGLYDRVSERLDALQEQFPELIDEDHPWNTVGY